MLIWILALANATFDLGTIITRSMRDKAPALFDLVASKGFNLLGIAAWPCGTQADLAEMTRPQSVLQFPRAKKRGRAGLFVSTLHKFIPISRSTMASFELIDGQIECGSSSHILNIYRSPGEIVLSSVSFKMYYRARPHFLTMCY